MARVLDLPLLPARRRGAGHRFDKIVPAHLQETAIVSALLATVEEALGDPDVVAAGLIELDGDQIRCFGESFALPLRWSRFVPAFMRTYSSGSDKSI